MFGQRSTQLEHDLDRSLARRNWIVYIGVYTVIFLGAFFIAYSPYFLEGKSFVWNSDGRVQHFPLLVYVGRLLRRVAQSFFQGNSLFPMFDLSLGLGEDIIGYLNSMGFNDPLMLLSVLVPISYAEHFFAFLTIFRVYLAGLSFLYLCNYFKKTELPSLAGSLIYCFSGYALFCSMRHPFFIMPMIQLPLLIVGMEKILRSDKPYVFVFAVFYAAICEYYHLYMMTIMIAVYAVVRFFDLNKTKSIKAFFSAVGRGALGYALGIGLSAVVLLPAAIGFLNGNRSGFSNFNPANYKWTYFRNRLLRLIAPSNGSGWTYPALAAIVFLALFLLFFAKRKYALKTLVIVTFATWLTDIGGLVMNGFQYSSNRWTFGLVLIFAFVTVEMLPELLAMTQKQKIICIGALCIYGVVVFREASARKLTFVLVGLCFLTLTVLCLTVSLNNQSNGDETLQHAAPRGKARGIVCVLLVMINVGINGIYMFAADQGDYIAGFEKDGMETKLLLETPEKEVKSFLLSDPEGRADSSTFTQNYAMVWQTPSMLTYNSVANGHIIDFFNQMEYSERRQAFNFVSSEQRTIANTLLSGKYHLEDANRIAYVPYGYTEISQSDLGRVVFENDYALPWGYTYDTVITYDKIKDLNGVQKQEIMLQAIALEEMSGGEEASIVLDERLVPYELVYQDCTWENGIIKVSQPDATITLTFNMPAQVEGYIRLVGFDINDSKQTSFYTQVDCEDISKSFLVTSHLYSWYYGRENYLINVGYSDEERNSLRITFPAKGTFKLSDIELYALPMDNYPARVEALREEPLENIAWSTNRLTGTIDLSKDKILCVSVPYSAGWIAKVDGKKVEILRGNYMFMALPLTAGYHDIEFTYCSPGIRLGALISLLSLGVVIGMLIHDKKTVHPSRCDKA